MTPVRVGIIGAGFIARFHAAMLAGAGAPNEIVAVHDTDRERAAALAADLGAEVAESPAALCEVVDAVFVCTWTSAHHEAVAAAVASGTPVFCEKPLAPDLAGAEALCDLLTGTGLTNQVGLVLRRSPAFTLARQLVAEPTAGRPMAVVFRDDQFLPVQGMYGSDWRADPARAGAGAVLEHSIHDVDLLEWLFGPVDSVSAWTRAFHGIVGIEDVATVAFSFAVRCRGIAGLGVARRVGASQPASRRAVLRAVARGRRGRLVRAGALDGDREGERVVEGAELLAALDPPLVDGGNPDSEFIAAVAAGRPAEPDVGEALRAHRVVEAIYRSAAAGGVPMPP